MRKTGTTREGGLHVSVKLVQAIGKTDRLYYLGMYLNFDPLSYVVTITIVGLKPSSVLRWRVSLPFLQEYHVGSDFHAASFSGLAR